jgi:hypothetical protein
MRCLVVPRGGSSATIVRSARSFGCQARVSLNARRGRSPRNVPRLGRGRLRFSQIASPPGSFQFRVDLDERRRRGSNRCPIAFERHFPNGSHEAPTNSAHMRGDDRDFADLEGAPEPDPHVAGHCPEPGVGDCPRHGLVENGRDDAPVDNSTEALMITTGDERGPDQVTVSREPQVQPDSVVIAAAEAFLIRAGDGKRIECVSLLKFRHRFQLRLFP